MDSKPNAQHIFKEAVPEYCQNILAVCMQLHHSLRNSRLSTMKVYKGLAPCDYSDND